jgi:hypothetical protein
MSQKIVLHREEPELTIDNIPESYIIAIETDWGSRHEKYILSCQKDRVTFSSGHGNWNSANTRTDLLNQSIRDGRVTIHVFTNLKDLAKWLLE